MIEHQHHSTYVLCLIMTSHRHGRFGFLNSAKGLKILDMRVILIKYASSNVVVSHYNLHYEKHLNWKNTLKSVDGSDLSVKCQQWLFSFIHFKQSFQLLHFKTLYLCKSVLNDDNSAKYDEPLLIAIFQGVIIWWWSHISYSWFNCSPRYT